jgi:hypothetical protein
MNNLDVFRLPAVAEEECCRCGVFGRGSGQNLDQSPRSDTGQSNVLYRPAPIETYICNDTKIESFGDNLQSGWRSLGLDLRFMGS